MTQKAEEHALVTSTGAKSGTQAHLMAELGFFHVTGLPVGQGARSAGD